MSLSFAPLVHAEEDDATEESTESISFVGQLIELSSTDVPTTIVVRDPDAGEDGGWVDYTVDIDSETMFGSNDRNTSVMSDWITGDWLVVVGSVNENTGVVTADQIINQSINPFQHRGLNGWITEINEDDSTMTVQWGGEVHVVAVTSNTRMVVPPTNPAALSDFEVGDRVRVRLIKDSTTENEARIIVALRRGDEIFLKARTRGFWAELNEIDDNGDGTGTIAVTLAANPHLREGDVNNLVGVEGDEEVVYFDEDTKFVRRFMGTTSPDEFVEGDILFIVGRVGDDETITARLIKDTSIWQKGVARHLSEITEIDTDENTLTVEGVRCGDCYWTVTYTDETTFTINGEEGDESDLEVGDKIRVVGTANGANKTIAATSIITRDSFRVLDRLRDELDLDEDAEEVTDEAEDEDAEESNEDEDESDEIEDADESDEDEAEDEDDDSADDASDDDADASDDTDEEDETV